MEKILVPLRKLFTPFNNLTKLSKSAILVFWLALLITIWSLSSLSETNLFPTPKQVLFGFGELWTSGIIVHLASSLSLCGQAIIYSLIISLFLTYITPIPFFQYLGTSVSKLRFLPLTGIAFYIGILITNGRSIQVWVLVMFMTTFLTTSLIQMIKDIPDEEFDHARTLGCNRWETLWEVVIKGRFDYVFELVRQNLAIVWVMLVTTESILIAAGGLGVLIKNNDRTGDNGKVVAVQIVIILVGLTLDFTITKLRKMIFRYSNY